MTGCWILLAALLIGGLFLAWRSDHKNKGRLAAFQGQTPGRMLDARADPHVAMTRHHRDSGSYSGEPGMFSP
ncbi:MAG: hypothetical protein M3313_13070 [Actinomycetota bacterium]|nr:hypothetical protein [Actinomycetota bacterium]